MYTIVENYNLNKMASVKVNVITCLNGKHDFKNALEHNQRNPKK